MSFPDAGAVGWVSALTSGEIALRRRLARNPTSFDTQSSWVTRGMSGPILTNRFGRANPTYVLLVGGAA